MQLGDGLGLQLMMLQIGNGLNGSGNGLGGNGLDGNGGNGGNNGNNGNGGNNGNNGGGLDRVIDFIVVGRLIGNELSINGTVLQRGMRLDLWPPVRADYFYWWGYEGQVLRDRRRPWFSMITKKGRSQPKLRSYLPAHCETLVS